MQNTKVLLRVLGIDLGIRDRVGPHLNLRRQEEVVDLLEAEVGCLGVAEVDTTDTKSV